MDLEMVEKQQIFTNKKFNIKYAEGKMKNNIPFTKKSIPISIVHWTTKPYD